MSQAPLAWVWRLGKMILRLFVEFELVAIVALLEVEFAQGVAVCFCVDLAVAVDVNGHVYSLSERVL